jgi:hypothetical protein
MSEFDQIVDELRHAVASVSLDRQMPDALAPADAKTRWAYA